jgi:hypothetical protein
MHRNTDKSPFTLVLTSEVIVWIFSIIKTSKNFNSYFVGV